MKSAQKRRPDDFKRRILERIYTSKSDLLNAEYRWLSQIKQSEIKIRYYNLKFSVGHWMQDDLKALSVREKISVRTREAMSLPENREKMMKGIGQRDNYQSEETRKKRSESMKRTLALKFPDKKVRPKFGSPEHRAGLSERSKKQWADPAFRSKISEAVSIGLTGKPGHRLGHKNSQEHNARILETKRSRGLISTPIVL
jgi:hypothetical protein